MAAVVSLASGTITTLFTPTAPNATAGNVPQIQNLDPNDLTASTPQGMASIPSEIIQFINLLSVGDGTTAVAGWGFDFWTTVDLVQTFLQALKMKGAPSSYNPR